VMVLDYVLLAYFLYIGIADFVSIGINIRNVFTIGLVLLQGIFLALFEFSWAPQIPLEVTPTFHIDQLSIIMSLLISIIGPIICIYGTKYMQDHERHLGLAKTRQPQFFFYMVMFLGAMNGLVFTNSLLWLCFFWEVTTLCCYALIRHDETPEAIGSGIRALWMNLIGGAGFVFAIIYAFNGLGTLSLAEIIKSPSGPLLLLPLAFLCLAAFTKSAQVPFQGWLLGAMVAPTPVSALLHSSTMVNAGVYLALRIAPAFHGTALSTAVAIFGGFTFMTTAILAISQGQAKRVLAYSTIGNLGLIILCAGVNTPLAITAGMMLLVFHAISKGLLFLCVGIIDHSIGSKHIEDMEGLVSRLPLVTTITIAGIISMLLAPFGVLISKWAAIEATGALASYWSPVILGMLVIGSAATVVFWVKWLGRLLTQVPGAKRARIEGFSSVYHIPVLLLIVGAIGLSIFIAPFYEGMIAPAVAKSYTPVVSTQNWFFWGTIGAFAAWPIFAVLALALGMPALLIKLKPEQTRPAYMCGENVECETPQFCSLADERTKLETGGFYLSGTLGERNLNKWFDSAALLILLVLFAVVVIV
jgi:ech hydrogenase subunit A